MKIKLLLMVSVFAFGKVFAQVPSYVPLNGLQGFWPFSGNANDLSGNNYNGTVNGAMLATDRFSNVNCAYTFNGSSDFISTAYSGITGTNSRAVAFWAKTNDSQSVMACISWGGNAQGTGFHCGFNYGATGATIDGAYGAITYSVPSTTFGNQWHHYVYQFSNPTLNQVEVYQDAVLIYQAVHSYNPTNSLNTDLGYVVFGKSFNPNAPDYFKGDLDEFGIWDRTLTACEIKALYTGSGPNSLPISTSGATICAGQTVMLSVGTGSNFLWSNSATSQSITVSPTVTTTYTASATDDLGCRTTGTVTVLVQKCTGLSDARSDWSTIYVNNNLRKIVVEAADLNYDMEIISVLGSEIYSARSLTGRTEVNLDDNAEGIYLVKITDKWGLTIKKILVE